MPFTLADRVMETSSTTGTGSFSLSGPVAGFRGFVAAVSNGAIVPYVASIGSTWEHGYGTVTAGPPDTLSRTTVFINSSGTTSLVNFPSGTKQIWLGYPATRAALVNESGNLQLERFLAATIGANDVGLPLAVTSADGTRTILGLGTAPLGRSMGTVTGSTTLQVSNRGALIIYNSASAGTLTLPAASSFGLHPITILCSNTGAATIARAGGDTITRPNQSSLTSVTVQGIGASVTLLCDGSSIWRVIAGTGTEAWIAPTFSNGWGNYGGGYYNLAYAKGADGLVCVRGAISGGTVGAAAFTFPAGYRPAAGITFAAPNGAVVGVASNGQCTVFTNPTPVGPVHMEVIKFYPEA